MLFTVKRSWESPCFFRTFQPSEVNPAHGSTPPSMLRARTKNLGQELNFFKKNSEFAGFKFHMFHLNPKKELKKQYLKPLFGSKIPST